MARPAAMSGRRRSERQACKWRTHCGEIANAAPFSALRGRPAMPVAEAFKAAQSQGGQGRSHSLQLIKKVCETAGKTISGDRLKDFFRSATAGRFSIGKTAASAAKCGCFAQAKPNFRRKTSAPGRVSGAESAGFCSFAKSKTATAQNCNLSRGAWQGKPLPCPHRPSSGFRQLQPGGNALPAFRTPSPPLLPRRGPPYSWQDRLRSPLRPHRREQGLRPFAPANTLLFR